MALKGMPPPLPHTTSLEVTVISGESVRLRSGRALSRGAYAVVQTPSSFAVTHVDEDADCCGYPYWDKPVRVELPPGARVLDVEICRSHGGGGGGARGRGESVAAARVPVEDFHVGPPGHLHCLSYRLFDTGGVRGRNGIVNITVRRLHGAGEGEGKPHVLPAMGKKAVDDGASGSGGSGYGVADLGKPAAAAGSAPGVVIGYPVGMPATGHAGGKGGV